ncbi:hypothetical protein SRABI96_01636 [Peribacillus sp. Bi96]|uniref:hypothetical protein n=1 Tax=unclassified Peribacillus TaxID=2675266 RepID=UPI001D703A11|nr:hypothetical protein [Peribacillus sp. Bi96]CAH0189584.1 hypothetical protein SRABI96_01636 [Peribacillus sp. Bi96]
MANITQLLPILFMLALFVFVIFIVLYLSRHFNRSKRIEEKLDEVLKKMASKKED